MAGPAFAAIDSEDPATSAVILPCRLRVFRPPGEWPRGPTEDVLMASTMIEEFPVQVGVGRVTLEGNLSIPPGARGVVLFAHGSGSGRHSTRNRFVAQELVSARLATLLIDLLTEDEEQAEMHTRPSSLRHRPARGSADRRDRLASRRAADGGAGGRLFRGEYRRRRGSGRRGRAAGPRQGRGVARRPARSGGRCPPPRHGPDVADCGWSR